MLKSTAICRYAITIKEGIDCYEKKIDLRHFAVNAYIIRNFLYFLFKRKTRRGQRNANDSGHQPQR
jgi:hypothetical protein